MRAKNEREPMHRDRCWPRRTRATRLLRETGRLSHSQGPSFTADRLSQLDRLGAAGREALPEVMGLRDDAHRVISPHRLLLERKRVEWLAVGRLVRSQPLAHHLGEPNGAWDGVMVAVRVYVKSRRGGVARARAVSYARRHPRGLPRCIRAAHARRHRCRAAARRADRRQRCRSPSSPSPCRLSSRGSRAPSPWSPNPCEASGTQSPSHR